METTHSMAEGLGPRTRPSPEQIITPTKLEERRLIKMSSLFGKRARRQSSHGNAAIPNGAMHHMLDELIDESGWWK